MQQPFKHIANAKRFIEKMSADLDNIKNPKVKDFQIDALNSFIMVINLFEDFMVNKYKLRSVDGLICSRLYDLVCEDLVNYNGVFIKEIVHKIDNDINYPLAMKDNLILTLNAEEVAKNIEGKGVFGETTREDWEVVVDKLLHQFKQQMVWS